jgi:uncharacterized protein (UPF0276 family)
VIDIQDESAARTTPLIDNEREGVTSGQVFDSHGCYGVGIGLRPTHLHDVLKTLPDIPWFEVHICNFLRGGLNRSLLHKIREHYPLSFHGVNLNLGGVTPLDMQYLGKLKRAVDELEPDLVSEHACFTAHDEHYFHDLLPVPFTDEAVTHMASRIRMVQDILEREILIENVSRYYQYENVTLTEGEFLSAVCEQSGCGLILDLNNAYVNEHNLSESLAQFVNDLPKDKVSEIHLAGFNKTEGQWIDSHSCEVSQDVWDLYKNYAEKFPHVPCLIEWDANLPALTVLQEQQRKAQSMSQQEKRRRL